MRPLLLLVFLAACPSAPQETAAPTPGSTPAARDVPGKIDFEIMSNTGRAAMFVPAPSELEAALARNAPGVKMGAVGAAAVPLKGLSQPLVALETGTRISDAISAAQAGDRADLVRRIAYAREGLVALKASPELLDRVDSFVADLRAERLSDAEIVPALDVLAEQIQDGLHESVDARISTLVQAGGWVQGAQRLARSLRGRELTADAGGLFRQASLVNHFLTFLTLSEPGRAGDPQVDQVVERLYELRDIAGGEVIGSAEVARIEGLTTEVLAILRRR